MLSSQSTISSSQQTIRLHLVSVPYTITTDEYSHDAFTGKAKRFATMMKSIPNFEVYHYGIEGANSNADRDVNLLTRQEWEELRIQTIVELDGVSREEAIHQLVDKSSHYNSLARRDSPLFHKFNERLNEQLLLHYRGRYDLVCLALDLTSHSSAVSNYLTIEVGVGYMEPSSNYRIYESYSWLAYISAKQNENPNNYYFVIPHSFDSSEYKLTKYPRKKRVGYLGRLIESKGCYVIGEIAKRFPDVEFVLCGKGDYEPFLTSPNVVYISPIEGSERQEFFATLSCLLFPTAYLEPFGCSAVEAQLCGVPVISSDWGGPSETVKHMKGGMRCHTLADYCYGVQLALEKKYDRGYIRQRAVKKYDMYNLASKYEYVFRTVLDRWDKGWFSESSWLVD